MATPVRPILRIFLPEAPPGGLAQLLSGIPGSRLTPLGMEIPLVELAPEEVLALCLRHGVTARATRIVSRSPIG